VCRGVNEPFSTTAFRHGCTAGYMTHANHDGVVVSNVGPTFPYLLQWWLWVGVSVLFADQVFGPVLAQWFGRSVESAPSPALAQYARKSHPPH
jgi:hypothetical protein